MEYESNKGVVEIDETQGTITLTQEAFEKLQRKHNFDNASARIQAKNQPPAEDDSMYEDDDRIARIEAQNQQILAQQSISIFEAQFNQATAALGLENVDKAMIANVLRSGSYETPEEAIRVIYANQIDQRQDRPSPSPSGSQQSEANNNGAFDDSDMENMFSKAIHK